MGGDLRYRPHIRLRWGCGRRAADGKIFRMGILDPSTASGSAVFWEALRQELSKLGWIEGKNIAIEYRFSEQKSFPIPWV